MYSFPSASPSYGLVSPRFDASSVFSAYSYAPTLALPTTYAAPMPTAYAAPMFSYPAVPAPLTGWPKIKIVYFKVRAKTEALKMILSASRIPYEEVSVEDYFGVGWPEAKALCAFGQLPVMEVDGKPIYQTGAQCRYAAKLAGLVPGEGFLDAAYADSVYEAAVEMSNSPTNINPIVNIYSGEKFEAEKAAFFESFPDKLANLAKQLGEKDYFCGSSPAYCDFAVWHHLDMALLLEPTALDAHPNMQSFHTRVGGLPGVQEYLAARPPVHPWQPEPEGEALPVVP